MIFSKQFILAVSFLVLSTFSFQESAFSQRAQMFKYKLKTGDEYAYEFNAEYEVDGETRESNGFVTFKVEDQNVPTDLSGQPLETAFEGEATSTAFAVSSDGYLLTCAHCVNGAESIQISSGEKSWEAKVIDLNVDRDLAILKMDAKDLPAVSLGKEVKVELAQDVRAVGYPLSDMLGDSVKISRGSIAGFIKQGFGESMQIDVAVNPGNSGGPLVDENGSVIGVVNAKLDGMDIAKVGFAIPIRDACAMLDKENVNYKPARSKQKLSGPELARQVTPAVFFVKAAFGKNGQKQFSNFRLSSIGSLKKKGEQEAIQSEAILGLNGDVLDSENETELPFLLGSVIQMPFEYLPGSSSNSWRRAGAMHLSIPIGPAKRRRSRFDPFGHLDQLERLDPLHRHPDLFPHFGPRDFFGRGNSNRPKYEIGQILGESEKKYRVLSRDDDEVSLECKYRVRSLSKKDTYSSLSFTSENKLTFDVKNGIFTRSALKGTLNLKLGEDAYEIPIKLNYRLVSNNESGASAKAPESNSAKANVKPNTAKPKRAVPLPPFELTEEQISQFVREFRDWDDQRLLKTLSSLATWKPKNEKLVSPQLVDALDQLVSNDSAMIRKFAIDALTKQDGSRVVPHLVKELDKANVFSKRGWIVKLGRTRTNKAASALVRLLEQPANRSAAKFALIENGSSGESAVLKVLQKSLDDESVASVCLEVLGEIGTRQSTVALKPLLKNEDFKLRENLNAALAAIAKRSS